jgi:hypothetical protein
LNLTPHECDVWRRDEVRERGKSPRYTWLPPTPDDTALPCFVQPANSRQIDIAARQKNYEITHKVYFPEDPRVLAMDRLKFNGRTLHVQAPAINLVEMDEAWALDVQEIQWEQTQQDS